MLTNHLQTKAAVHFDDLHTVAGLCFRLQLICNCCVVSLQVAPGSFLSAGLHAMQVLHDVANLMLEDVVYATVLYA